MSGILYFDCRSGISGDMTIGALLDLGIDRNKFIRQLKELGLKGYELQITEKKVNGISATDFKVTLTDENSYHHVNLPDIEKIIGNSGLNNKIKGLSKKIFRCIAEAEMDVHNLPVEQVHFHEVGAVDSIIDIVGTAICMSMLNPDSIYSSPLHLGSGFVKCSHGLIPVPAPATVEILKGVPVYSTGIQGELVTPTGAAIVKTLAAQFINLPSMKIEKAGYGTGKKSYDIPNALRVFFGQEISLKELQPEELLLLETNIDDMSPEIYSFLFPLLFKKGALDVYLTNIIMKKGRPAVMLSVLCEPENQAGLKNIIFTETTTLGIRQQIIRRDILERETITMDTRFGRIKAKAAFKDGRMLRLTPEYEECKRVAEEQSMPLRKVYDLLAAEIRAFISNRSGFDDPRSGA
ncbi:MAG: nickel pincer cofactor biosynthesis protein LarC [Spirochaetes bacterium]|nr:nickel pincer cofactor biosynthesis protein LarC [Spirochaetota bacterium]